MKRVMCEERRTSPVSSHEATYWEHQNGTWKPRETIWTGKTRTPWRTLEDKNSIGQRESQEMSDFSLKESMCIYGETSWPSMYLIWLCHLLSTIVIFPSVTWFFSPFLPFTHSRVSYFALIHLKLKKTTRFGSKPVLIPVRPHGWKKKVGVRRARIFSDHSDIVEQYIFCTIPLEKVREGIYLLIFIVFS